MSVDEIVKLYEAQKHDKLTAKLKEVPLNSLVKLVKDALNSDEHDKCTNFLRALFQGWENAPDLSEVIVTVYKLCLKVLQQASADDSFLIDLISILNHEAVRLATADLVELCSILLNMIHNAEVGEGKWLKLFTKLLEVVDLHTGVRYDKSEDPVTGTQYKHHVICEICSCTWPTDSVVHLANAFKDIKLEAEDADIVVTKLLEQLGSLESQLLPPYVYQLLGLATKCGQVETALRGILKHFMTLDEKFSDSKNLDDSDAMEKLEISENELRSVEGTVLLYISNTVRQNQTLGKGIMKLLKSAKESLSTNIISPFFLALGLVLAQDSRFNEETQTLVRTIVNKCCQDKHKIERCKWLQNITTSPPDVKAMLLQVVKNCRNGWESVVSGIMDLGFNLMSFYGPKPGAFGRCMEREIAKTLTPGQECCDIGLAILAATFKMHSIARKDVIQRIISEIQTSNNAPAYHFIRLLKSIIKTYPYALVQSVGQIKAMLEEMYMMHPYNVQKLLPSLMPLVRTSGTLRDSLILVLRKLLSSREVNCRISAVSGFLLIVQNFPLSEVTSLSQISSQSTQSIFSTASSQNQSEVFGSQGRKVNNELLCLEILQTLSQRCFTQQAEVRHELYRNLGEVMSANPRLTPYILDYLLRHIRSYYEEVEDVIPPVKLKKCMTVTNDSCVLAEPIAALLSTIYMCLHKLKSILSEDEIEEILDNDVVEQIHGIFKSLSKRMCKCELEDFNLERNADFSSNTKVGQKNNITASLVLSIYNTLIEYNSNAKELTYEKAELMLSLHGSIKRLNDFMQATKSMELSGKSFVEKQLQSISFVQLSNLVYTLFFDETMGSEDSVKLLQNSDNFVKHLMQCVQNLLQFAKDRGYFPGIGGLTKSEIMACMVRIGRACLHKFLLEKNEPCQSSVTLPSLECFHLTMAYISTWHPDSMVQFTSDIISRDEEATQPDQDSITMLLRRFQRITMTYLSTEHGSLSAVHRKLVFELSNLITTLAGVATTLSLSSTVQTTADWCHRLCKEKKLDDTNTVKRILQLTLQTSILVTPDAELFFQDLSSDLYNELGAIDENADSESQSQAPKRFCVITEENAQSIIPIVVTFLESVVQDADWLMHHMKGGLLCHGSKKRDIVDVDDEDESMQEGRRKAEGSICERMNTVAAGLLYMAHTSASTAANVEQFVRAFTVFFTFLNGFSKYYVWLYAQGIGHIPASFEKLCKFISSELLQMVYSFIIYAENVQSERLESAKAKKDGKKKGKEKLPDKPTTGSMGKNLRETKGIAKLVFAIEQQENSLILLGKRAKVDLLRHHRLTTTRDFRIKNDIIRISRAEEEANKELENDENVEPSSKRPCLQTSFI